MQKKLSLALSIMMFAGITNSVNAAKSNIQKAIIGASLVTIASGGAYANDMNAEYSRKKKRPDAKMRIVKSGVLAATIIGIDVILGDDKNTARNVAKVGCVLASMLAASQTVADVIRSIPLVGGVFTDPVDENGNEQTDTGAFSRFAIAHVAIRKAVLPYFPGDTTNK